MTNINEQYSFWSQDPFFDAQTRKELATIHDEKEIRERFIKTVSFGTGGARGLMGAGTNRINPYTIRLVSKGFFDYLQKEQPGGIHIAIAHDTRHRSKEFAHEAAKVLCACGAKVSLFGEPTPTPVLSFAVRQLGCAAGVVVTASHNPKEYNGYKTYNSAGCQMVPRETNAIQECISRVGDIRDIPLADLDEQEKNGSFAYVDSSIMEAYLKAAQAQAMDVAAGAKKDLSIVYTPLFGAGCKPVQALLRLDGFTQVRLVEEQAQPDGAFPHLSAPNPEEHDALNAGMSLAKKTGADIVIGTDPDSDRMGAAIQHNGAYHVLNGNQIGVLLVDSIIKDRYARGMLNDRSTIVSTVVTSNLGPRIAQANGLHAITTLTGFKFIGEQMDRFAQTGSNEFVMGYEESYGYLAGDYARDKDAVSSAMLLCELAAQCKADGKTLLDYLEKIYVDYGYHLDVLEPITLKGLDGQERIGRIMDTFRAMESFGDEACSKEDYLHGYNGLPGTNLVKFVFENGSFVAFRPSGTEPKLKIYYSVCAASQAAADKRMGALQQIVKGIIDQ